MVKAVFGDPSEIDGKSDGKISTGRQELSMGQWFTGPVDDRVGVGFEIYRGLSRRAVESTEASSLRGNFLSGSIEMYRRHAESFDGKSDAGPTGRTELA
jgi:hypothetical protein